MIKKFCFLFFTSILSACGVDHATVRLNFKNSGNSIPKRSRSLPSTASGFNCYAVNVMAADIPASANAPSADAIANVVKGSTCSYPGVVSDLIPSATTSATLSLKVPAGKSRVFQVLGVNTASGNCAGVNLADHFSQTSLDDSSVLGVYEIGRLITDVTASQTLSVSSAYNFRQAREVRCHCELPAYKNAANFAGGDGSLGNPFHICSTTHFLNINSHLTSNFIVDQALDFTNSVQANGFASSSAGFQGSLDGQGYAISNYQLNSSSTDAVGMFNYVQDGLLKNLLLNNANVTATSSAVTGLLVGVLSGQVQYTQVAGVVTGGAGISGGVVGSAIVSNNLNLISHCQASVLVVATGNSVGGLVGRFENGSLDSSSATGAVSNNCFSVATTNGAGGLIGSMGLSTAPSVTKSFATGRVASTNSSGGFIGTVVGGTVSNSYSQGEVDTFQGSTPPLGGFIGTLGNDARAITVDHCYSSTELVGATATGGGRKISGFVAVRNSGVSIPFDYSNFAVVRLGSNADSAAQFTTAQLKTATTFPDFDFTNIWKINEGKSFPFLQ